MSKGQTTLCIRRSLLDGMEIDLANAALRDVEDVLIIILLTKGIWGTPDALPPRWRFHHHWLPPHHVPDISDLGTTTICWSIAPDIQIQMCSQEDALVGALAIEPAQSTSLERLECCGEYRIRVRRMS